MDVLLMCFGKKPKNHRLTKGRSSSDLITFNTASQSFSNTPRRLGHRSDEDNSSSGLLTQRFNTPASQAVRKLDEKQLGQLIRQNLLHVQEQPRLTIARECDVIKSVYFTCELLGDEKCMTKPDILNAIDNCLTEKLSSEDEEQMGKISILLLLSLNKKDVREVAIETIARYLQNMIENPEDPKFRRIRMANKAFQERVASVRGGREVLTAIGFHEKEEPLKEGEPSEAFLVMDESTAKDTDGLLTIIDWLMNGESVPIKVSRDAKIFLLCDGESITVPQVPREFYNWTNEEIEKRKQSEEFHRKLCLRTKEMRARDELKRKYQYKYTSIRICFPDKYVLQGTFGCYETGQAVHDFVSGYLADPTVIFSLKDSTVRMNVLKTDETLRAAGLTSTAVLHFVTDKPNDGAYLAEEHITKNT